MIGWKDFANLRVFKSLLMKRGAVMTVENDDNTTSDVSVADLAILSGVTASAAELNIMDGVLATTAEINRVADVSTRVIAAGASLALTEAAHDGKTILMDQASGTTLTLPAATGSGARFKVIVSVTVTSNQHRIDVVGNDSMKGNAHLAQDAGDTSVIFEAAADTDRINMNGTTTGGLQGTIIELEDIATDVWWVRLSGAATGTEATPFVTGAVS